MKHLIIKGMAAAAVVLMCACHKGATAHTNEEDGHDAHTEAHEHSESNLITLTDIQMREANVQTTAVTSGAFSEVVEVSGRILPAAGSEATVSATMSGIVSFAKSTLTEGMAVSTGTPLFTVNAQQVANGNPASAAQSELAAAKAALERAEKLVKEHILSQRELEEAERRYQTAQATAQSLGSAQQTRSMSASMSGFVKQILVKPGDYVETGQPLAVITQNKRLQLRADLPERHADFLSCVKSANIRLQADGAERVYSLSSLHGALAAKGAFTGESHFVPITFSFDNVHNFVPGVFVEVFLLGAERQNILSVPTEALAEAQGVHFVYVEHHPREFVRREVTLGATNGTHTEIVSGLKAGERIVTSGVTAVRLAANASAVPEGHSHSH